MRLTFISPTYPPSFGGAQLLVERLAVGLARDHGHDVRVVTTDSEFSATGPRSQTVARGVDHRDGITVERLAVARRTHSVLRSGRRVSRRLRRTESSGTALAPWHAGPLGLGLVNAVRRAGRDSNVVIGVAAPFLSLLGPQLAAIGRPSVRTVTLPLLHLSGPRPHPVTMSSLRRADLTIACTAYEREWLVQQGLDPARVGIIPPGCEPDAFVDMEPAEARTRLGVAERPTVGYIGRMAPHKGVDVLLAAMERIWDELPETNLVLAGRAVGWAWLDDAIARLQDRVGDRLTVVDGFDGPAKARLYAACDVIAFPSREESFGMVTTEAWCARRPVVAGDIGAVRSVIREHVDGLLVDPMDDAALAESLTELLADPDRRSEMGLEGRRRAVESFDWTHVVGQWEDALRSLRSESTSQRPTSSGALHGLTATE